MPWERCGCKYAQANGDTSEDQLLACRYALLWLTKWRRLYTSFISRLQSGTYRVVALRRCVRYGAFVENDHVKSRSNRQRRGGVTQQTLTILHTDYPNNVLQAQNLGKNGHFHLKIACSKPRSTSTSVARYPPEKPRPQFATNGIIFLTLLCRLQFRDGKWAEIH